MAYYPTTIKPDVGVRVRLEGKPTIDKPPKVNDLTGVQIDFGYVKSIDHDMTAEVKRIKMVIFGYERAFCIDYGVKEQYTINFTRVGPPDGIEGGSDSTRWTNPYWIRQLKKFTNRWQTMTDGYLLYITPDDSTLYPKVFKNVYIRDTNITYQGTPVIDSSITFYVGTIFMGKADVNQVQLTYNSNTTQFGMQNEIMTQWWPLNTPVIVEQAPLTWAPVVGGRVLRGWTKDGPSSTNIQYRPGDELFLIGNMTLWGVWQEPTNIIFTHDPDTDIIQPLDPTTKYIEIFMCGGGGGGGGGQVGVTGQGGTTTPGGGGGSAGAYLMVSMNVDGSAGDSIEAHAGSSGRGGKGSIVILQDAPDPGGDGGDTKIKVMSVSTMTTTEFIAPGGKGGQQADNHGTGKGGASVQASGGPFPSGRGGDGVDNAGLNDGMLPLRAGGVNLPSGGTNEGASYRGGGGGGGGAALIPLNIFIPHGGHGSSSSGSGPYNGDDGTYGSGGGGSRGSQADYGGDGGHGWIFIFEYT